MCNQVGNCGVTASRWHARGRRRRVRTTKLSVCQVQTSRGEEVRLAHCSSATQWRHLEWRRFSSGLRLRSVIFRGSVVGTNGLSAWGQVGLKPLPVAGPSRRWSTLFPPEFHSNVLEKSCLGDGCPPSCAHLDHQDTEVTMPLVKVHRAKLGFIYDCHIGKTLPTGSFNRGVAFL